MKIIAQLSGVNRPLSVELRLISFCSCDFDSQEKHDTSSSCGVLTKRSDFRSAEGLVRCSPFGGATRNFRQGGPMRYYAFPCFARMIPAADACRRVEGIPPCERAFCCENDGR